MARSGSATLRDDLLRNLGRCAGDELVVVQCEPWFGVEQSGGTGFHSWIACEHFLSHFLGSASSLQRLSLGRGEGDITPDGELIRSNGKARPFGFFTVSAE